MLKQNKELMTVWNSLLRTPTLNNTPPCIHYLCYLLPTFQNIIAKRLLFDDIDFFNRV